MSLMAVEAKTPCAETINVSVDSVKLSAEIAILIFATPSEPIVAFPESEPVIKSATLTPLNV